MSKKRSYYLWRNSYDTQEEFEAEYKKKVNEGYRVVTFIDGNPKADINIAMKNLIRNHMYDR